MRTFDLIGGGFWLVFALLVMTESVRLGLGSIGTPGAGLFPFLTALLLAALALLMVVENLNKSKGGTPVWAGETNWMNLLSVLVSMLVYGLAINHVGFSITTFFFLLFLFKKIDPLSWSASLIGSLITVGVRYLIFNTWLQCQLPEGVFLGKLFSFM
jgi:putative tricarboxylic transport membrane protein